METIDREMTQAEAEFYAEIEEAGHDIQAVGAYIANVGAEYAPLASWQDWIDDFTDAYQGEMTTREFAEQLADDTLLSDPSLSQWLVTYFDYEKFERDLFLGDYWESNGYIFRSF